MWMTNNVFFSNIIMVRNAVNKFLDTINKVPTQTVDRLCVRM